MPLPTSMDACMHKVKKEFPHGRTKKDGKSKKAAHKQHVAMCLHASGQSREGVEATLPSFKEYLVEDEMQRLRNEISALYKERDRYPSTVGLGREPDPRRRRVEAAIRAKREQINDLKARAPARADIEAGRETMRNAPPPSERPKTREPSTLHGKDQEAAIRMAVEELSQGVPGTVSGQDISDYIKRALGETVSRRTVDMQLSNNPALRDLEKFRKVGRTAGTTDRDRELRYQREMAKHGHF